MICVVEGCDKSARTNSAQWCRMHYHRWYRHNDVDKAANGTGITASYGRRYRSVYRQNHPVASRSGRVYIHRMVLYDVIGPGQHNCHWCGAEVRWNASRTDPCALQADHLNHIGDDNRPENLVPSCRKCNTKRGQQRRHQALVSAGWWANNDTQDRK